MKIISLILDTEASGPAPNHGDLISFALVVPEEGFERHFRSPDMRPECDKYNEGAYESIGMTREQHLNAPASIQEGMDAMVEWLATLHEPHEKVRFQIISDNPAFDFMWIAVACWDKLGYCPFGHSARRIGDFYAGLVRDHRATGKWKKKFRKTKHSHDPLDDSMGNAESWVEILKRMKDGRL